MILSQCKPLEEFQGKNLLSETPFGVCYAKVSPEQVANYEMVIIEPDFYSKSEIENLQKNGTKIIAYTTLGEIDSNRWYYPEMEARGFKGVNKNWGSSYIDLSDSTSRSIILDKALPEILIKGVDGIFLDTIDAVAPYTERSDLEPYMIQLIKEIRNRYPDITIIQNAGLFLLDETSSFIDALLIEDIASGYDFDKKEYKVKDFQSFSFRLEMLREVEKDHSIPIFIIDFAETEAGVREVKSRLDSLNFPYFISNIQLSVLPVNSKEVANKVFIY